MNTSFVPLVKSTGTLKEKIENITQIATVKGNTGLISKIGVVKGLYSAYELAPSIQLMEAIAKALAEIIEELLTFQIPIKPFVGVGKAADETDIYVLFRDYLLKNGFSKSDGSPTTTVDVYVRALKRVLKNDDPTTSDEICNLINNLKEVLIALEDNMYNVNRLSEIADLLSSIINAKMRDESEIKKSKKDHGTSISALKRFLMFIIWLIDECRKNQVANKQ